MSTVTIAVATHKEFPFSLPQGYVKLQTNCFTNKSHWAGYIHDDDGDNISEKNSTYCELTALYWLWKNSDADIKGLCHYRRFFCKNTVPLCSPHYFIDGKNLHKEVMKVSTMKYLLRDYDAIVLAPYAPYSRTAKQDLLIYCYEKDIDILTSVINEFFPEYQDAYYSVMSSHNISYCNMIVAEKTVFNKYCSWLFSVLAMCEQRCNIECYDAQHKRIYGYLAEVLMNVYLKKHGLNTVDLRCVLVSDFQTNGSGKHHLISYCAEKASLLLCKLGGRSIMEMIYRYLRPNIYNVYAQYQKCCKNSKIHF